MRIPGMPQATQPLPGAVPASIVRVSAAAWSEAAVCARESGCRLVTLWGTDHRERDGAFSMFAAYAIPQGLCVVELPVPASRTTYPDLSGVFPVANRLQRAVRDLLGLVPEDGDVDLRAWLRHGAWREDEFPLRRDFARAAPLEPVPDAYPFVRVEGDGVHEIAVGPIHAGIIEPGHFRFSVVGEKVLRLEEHLGYTHKGIDKRFEDFTIGEGYRLAGRVSGDSTVAYAWAYAQAAESVLAVRPAPRALWLRSLMLERERVANHLGDLGALGNDGGFGFALAQFMRLKEDWLRASGAAFGHRFMMDRIVPGGVDADPGQAQLEGLARQANAILDEVRAMRRIFDEHSGLQDRFITTGRVPPSLAHELGLAGLAGRASGQAHDLRADLPAEPYGALKVKKVVYQAGDVAARVNARFDEISESLHLIGAIVEGMPAGEVRVGLPEAREGAFGVGWIEGWRGAVLVALEAGAGGRIRRCHAHDPSWHNWPLIEHAVMGNIVPDFPLINKSFNLSYSGVDC
jgi:Ni,Fe-hydrogenase III large subunit/Ni,Fe-hydrogenase III component G